MEIAGTLVFQEKYIHLLAQGPIKLNPVQHEVPNSLVLESLYEAGRSHWMTPPRAPSVNPTAVFSLKATSPDSIAPCSRGSFYSHYG